MAISRLYDGGVAETVVFLHGFGGTRHAWDRVIAALDPQRYRPLALDLPGHGELSSYNRPITFAGCVEEVLTAAPERFALCGYSMGGRVALRIALAAPERLMRLVLVSSSPGIENEQERARRRLADHSLADELEREPFEQFIDRWNAQALFAEDPPAVVELARQDQLRNVPRALAAAMRGIGAGEMPSLWDRLGDLRLPVKIVVGNRDRKFRALGRQMHRSLPGSGDFRSLPGGHRLPLENPAAVARELSGSFNRGQPSWKRFT
jgi:2-succinyl-6-hydroxy-2,4-cyclohexadiene-1-carboxylate synthase